MRTRFLAAMVSLLAAALPAHATTIGTTTLGKLTSGADLIVVGKVVRVIDVAAGERKETLRVAEVEVLECLKGLPRPKRIWYFAEGTEDADWSTGFKGEKSVLFLGNPMGHIASNDPVVRARLKSAVFRKSVLALTGGAPLLQICWAGRGRMPVDRVESAEYATVAANYVNLPADTPTIPGADPRFADYERRVPLDDLVGRIKRRLSPVEPPAGEKAVAAFKILDELDDDTIPSPSHKAEKLLEELGETAVPALFDLLEDPAFPRRDTVAEALFHIGGTATEALADGLESKDPARRKAAAFALEWAACTDFLFADDLFPAGLEPTDYPDPEVRARTVGALNACREHEPIPAVVTALSDKSFGVRRSAVRTLTRLRLTFTYIEDSDSEEESQPEKAEAALLPLAFHGDVDVRREVWEVLAHAAGPATLPAALKALEDADRVVRVNAIGALARVRAPQATKRLILLVSSEDMWVRRTAAHALGVWKIVEGVGALAKALGDPDGVVVRIAIQGLRAIGPPAAPAVPALERLLETTGAHLESRIKKALEEIRK